MDEQLSSNMPILVKPILNTYSVLVKSKLFTLLLPLAVGCHSSSTEKTEKIERTLSSVSFKRTDSANFSLKKREDHLNNFVVYYLFKGNHLLDSMRIDNIYFDLDTLIEIKPDFWYCLYDPKCGSNCNMSYQSILTIKKNKIHRAYMSYYKYSESIDNLYTKDGTQPEELIEFPHQNFEYVVDKDSFLRKSQVIEKVKRQRTEKVWMKDENNYLLKFDSLNQVYYTDILPFYGLYIVDDNQTEPKEINLKMNLPCLNYKFHKWVYYDNFWFYFIPEEKRFIKEL